MNKDVGSHFSANLFNVSDEIQISSIVDEKNADIFLISKLRSVLNNSLNQAIGSFLSLSNQFIARSTEATVSHAVVPQSTVATRTFVDDHLF